MCALIMSYSDFLERALQVERAHTHTTSRCEFQDYREILDQGASFINGYSGEYAPAFSNKLHPCSVLNNRCNDEHGFICSPRRASLKGI